MSVQSYKGQGIDPYRGNPIPKQKIKEASFKAMQNSQ